MRKKAYISSIYERAVLIIVVAAVVLCALTLKAAPDDKPESRSAKAFTEGVRLPSHKTHIGFIKECDDCRKDCTDCHALDKKTDSYRPDPDFCRECHLSSPPQTSINRIKGRKMKGILFGHTTHEQRQNGAKIACRDCHESTLEDEQIKYQPLVAPERCFSCHADRGIGFSERSCDRCHIEKRRNRLEPSNHDHQWRRTHGEQARWSAYRGHREQCVLCHQNAACVACHRTERPLDHTGLWRVRMHGIAAQWDRDRCKTCHETGACISCHQRTPPTTHRVNWVARHGRVAGFENRCTVCHTQSWCNGCHRGNNR
ncbi:MAG: hypothetical protein JXA30_20155 [Deltaproteobacteria bacterium]|nr:hypothetical protein [Deltaproteobacteria bacterium]